MPLTGKQVRHLRSLGHHLEPVVQIGKNGITDALVAQIGEALLRHELIKVKLVPESPVDRHDAGAELAAASGAELVQLLGKTLLLWKRNPEAARIELPKAGKKAKPAAAAPRPEPRRSEAALLEDDEDAPPPRPRPERRPAEDRRSAPRASADKRPAPRASADKRAVRRAGSDDRSASRVGADRYAAPREDSRSTSRARADKRPYNRDRRVDDRTVPRADKPHPRPPARRGPSRSS